jgi:hypothetical protein
MKTKYPRLFMVMVLALPAPAVISGNNTVTNPLSGTQKFYRLSQ